MILIVPVIEQAFGPIEGFANRSFLSSQLQWLSVFITIAELDSNKPAVDCQEIPANSLYLRSRIGPIPYTARKESSLLSADKR